MSQPTYRADIDGLRAVAVLPVVFYHAGFSYFSGGFVGVDVFFVISGFLITSIIAGEIERDEFSFAHFYERRARRLFPALFSVIGVASIFACVLLMPWELEDFGQSVATTTLFSSNFLFFTEAGYFDGPAELKPLLHTWSLAIEEQYYLLFPGFLLLVRRYLNHRFIVATLGLFAVSFAISVWSTANAASAAFYLLPSRTWELLLGSLLALAPTMQLRPLWRELGSVVGVIMIGVAVFTYDATTAFPGLAAVLPCFGTALVLLCGQHHPTAGATWTMRMLSLRPVVFVGLISYSLYLWHWPILVFAKHYLLRPLHTGEAWVLVTLAFLVAAGSWRFIEQPFRGRGSRLNRQQILRLSAAAMLTAIIVGVALDTSKGWPQRLPEPVARIAAVADDKPAERKHCEGIRPHNLTYDRVCRVNDLPVTPTFGIWGDSHAMAMMPSIGAVAKRAGVNGLNLTSNGCVPLLGVSRPTRDLRAECLAFSQAVVEILAAHPEITTVVLASRWARHAEGTVFGDESGDTLFLATPDRVAATVEENRAIFDAALDRTLTSLQAMNRQVAVIGSIPETGYDLPNVLAKALWHGQTLGIELTEPAYLARQAHVAAAFRHAATTHTFRLFDPAPYFCSDERCALTTPDGLPLYFDDNHVSSHGARRLEPLLQQVFSQSLF